MIDRLPEYPNFNDIVTLPWDRWALTADWHCPFVNKKLFKELLKQCRRHKIKHLVIGGDFLDLNAFSKFFQLTRVRWAEEKEYARQVLQILQGAFKEIYFMASNHEMRYLKAFQHGCMGEKDDLFDMLSFDNKHVIWHNKMRVGNWMIIHPRTARRLQLSFARSIAPQYPGLHIALAHGHLQGLTTTENGKQWLLDIGMMGDPDKFEYVNINQTSYQHWVSGAALIDGDNPPHLLWGNRL